jgi:ubiquinone/menaquinone biosynthesis C-methylase UbiE
MPKFDSDFYNFIYGSIHHHEYADNRANELIRMYGKGTSLEIGCGCGILVKAMRNKGAKAFGMDISEYATSEACSEFIIRADARKLPFHDDSFDLVHSWAVLGYNDEAETRQIISELNRVGRKQYHTIDLQQKEPYTHGYVFMRPRPWWDEQIRNDA